MILKEYAEAKGLAINEQKGIIYGRLDGYFITVKQDKTLSERYTLELGIKGKLSNEIITSFLNDSMKENPYLKKAYYIENKMTAEFETEDLNSEQYESFVTTFIEHLMVFLKENAMETCCEVCGSRLNVSLYQIENDSAVLCSTCCKDAVERLEQKYSKSIGQKCGSAVLGTIGALGGALLGGVMWVLVYQTGYMCAIVGALMVFLAIKGYQLFARKLDTKGIMISCIVSVLVLFFSEMLCIAILIMETFHCTIIQAIASIPAFLKEIPELKRAMAGDMVIALLLMGVGAYGTIKKALQQRTRNVPVSKITEMVIDLK